MCEQEEVQHLYLWGQLWSHQRTVVQPKVYGQLALSGAVRAPKPGLAQGGLLVEPIA